MSNFIICNIHFSTWRSFQDKAKCQNETLFYASGMFVCRLVSLCSCSRNKRHFNRRKVVGWSNNSTDSLWTDSLDYDSSKSKLVASSHKSLTHKSLHGIAPLYISELLERRNVKQPRTLRSSQCNLTVPKTNTKTYGDRAFQKVAPNLWNNLPDYLMISNDFNDFKSLLKTYLFNQAYF